MARESAFTVEGTVIEVLPNGTCRVELANGHRVLAFVAGRARLTTAEPALGEKVKLEMSPFDLSEGRIVVAQQKI
jgi:translation initiation factor IF-1